MPTITHSIYGRAGVRRGGGVGRYTSITLLVYAVRDSRCEAAGGCKPQNMSLRCAVHGTASSSSSSGRRRSVADFFLGAFGGQNAGEGGAIMLRGDENPGDDIATPPADGRSEEGCCDAMGCASMLGAPAELVERSAMEEVEGRRERSARTAERTKAGRHAVIHEGERAVVCSD